MSIKFRQKFIPSVAAGLIVPNLFPPAELVKAPPADDAASLRLRIKEEVRANVEKRKSQQSMGGGRNGLQLQGKHENTCVTYRVL